MPHIPNFKINFSQFHIRDCFLSLNSYVWTWKFEIIRTSYELSDLLTHSFVFVPSLWWVSKSSFFHSISYIAPLASIRMFEHKNPISYKATMNFLIYSRTLVFDFLICAQVWFFLHVSRPTFKIKFFLFHIIDCSIWT